MKIGTEIFILRHCDDMGPGALKHNITMMLWFPQIVWTSPLIRSCSISVLLRMVLESICIGSSFIVHVFVHVLHSLNILKLTQIITIKTLCNRYYHHTCEKSCTLQYVCPMLLTHLMRTESVSKV